MCGGVNRSTPIDLKTIDVEVASIAGRNPKTPIGMKELWDEVQSLKGSLGNSVKLDFGQLHVTNGITKSAGFNVNSAIAIGYGVRSLDRGNTITVNITNIIKSGQSGNSSVLYRPVNNSGGDPSGFSVQVSGKNLIVKRPNVSGYDMGRMNVIVFAF